MLALEQSVEQLPFIGKGSSDRSDPPPPPPPPPWLRACNFGRNVFSRFVSKVKADRNCPKFHTLSQGIIYTPGVRGRSTPPKFSGHPTKIRPPVGGVQALQVQPRYCQSKCNLISSRSLLTYRIANRLITVKCTM